MKASKSSKIQLLVALLAVSAIVVAPVTVDAATDSDNTTVSVQVGGTISIVSSHSVSISITPTVGGVYSSAKDTVTVTTNNSGGYVLTMKDADATANLVSGGNTFTPGAGTPGAPAALTAGQWGYAVAGAPFDGSYTPTNSASIDSSKWAAVPGSGGTAATLKSTGSAAPSGDSTDVWYAAAANASQASGTYTDIVTYTATTN